MLMEQRPGALPMGILILSLIAIFFCVCLCVGCCIIKRLDDNDGFDWEDCGPCKLAAAGRRPASMKPRPSLSGQDSAAEVELREPVATIGRDAGRVVAPDGDGRPRGQPDQKCTPPPAAEAPPAPEAFAFANPDGSVQCATSQPSAESRVESA